MSQTRRDFLKQAALAGGVAAVGPLGAAAYAQESPAEMCIARWTGAAATPEAIKAMAIKLTEQAMAAVGGMGRFVKAGDTVWIKPNVAWDRTPEMAANTNPDVVATLVRLSLEAGAKSVKVGDYTCNEATRAYTASGIEAAVKEAGGLMVLLDENRFKDVELKGQRLTTWPLYPEIIESDLVINVPIVKHHALAKATTAMKNYMGVIGGNRNSWHQELASCLCDIVAFMKPRLCVLDAVRILTANGPTGGNLADVKQMNMVAAGTDIVALDAWGVGLLGLKPEDVAYIPAGEKAGLGKMDYKSIAKEIEVA